MQMDVAVIGGDLRMAYLAQTLRARGLDARAAALERADLPGLRRMPLAALGEAEYLVLNAPLQAKLTDETLEMDALLQQAAKGAKLIFAGPGPAPELDAALHRVYDLSGDEDFLRRNARLTAEGAVAAAMAALPDSLADARCLVIGWGRIGQALTELLVAIGARVTVASRREKSRSLALTRSAAAVETAHIADMLGGMDVVFSTPPHPVLDETTLHRANPEARIIDLASAPYGVDLEAARHLGLNAWREPGLPGRYCPRSAARVLADRVLEIIRRERGGLHA